LLALLIFIPKDIIVRMKLSMSKKTFILLFLSTVFLSVIAYFIYKLHETNSLNITSTRPVSSNNNLKAGIFKLGKEGDYGSRTITIIGTLRNIEKEGDSYIMKLLVPIRGVSKDFKIDLGKRDNIISEMKAFLMESGEELGAYERNATVRNIRQEYSLVKVRDVYKNYSKLIGKIIRVDIQTKIDVDTIYGDPECDHSCRNRVEEYLKYKDNNQKLESLSNSEFSGVDFTLEFGAPTLISQYTLIR